MPHDCQPASHSNARGELHMKGVDADDTPLGLLETEVAVAERALLQCASAHARERIVPNMISGANASLESSIHRSRIYDNVSIVNATG
eukprot:6315775-Karenia_brevis.AAC.1